MSKDKLIICSTNKTKKKDLIATYNWYYKGSKEFDISVISDNVTPPEETSDSILINACNKASYYAGNSSSSPFSNTFYVSDDSAFYVNALGGVPGARVKRWCLETNEKIEDKILRRLKENDTRECCVSSAVAISVGLSAWGEVCNQRGSVPLKYTKSGYKGIFIPEGCDKTLGELDYKESLDPKINPRSRAFLTVLSSIQ